jgi:hypothetical protein
VALRAQSTLCADELYERELIGQRHAAGLWSHKAYQVLDAADPEIPRGSFRIIEGNVTSAAVHGNVVYINFGPDWRTDFTIRAQGVRIAKALGRTGLTPMRLEGSRVSVRGWVENWDGPMIKLTHLGQINILSPNKDKTRPDKPDGP